MRLDYLLFIAVSALLVSRECDATSPATKLLRTQKLIDDDRRLLRSGGTTNVDDEERMVSLKSFLELTKLKKAPANLEKIPKKLEKAPFDLNKTPIVVKKIRADFSKKYVREMLENETFKRKMFKKWDVYTEKEIVPKMKKLSDPALALEYLNRRRAGIRAGTIVTGKASINTNMLSA